MNYLAEYINNGVLESTTPEDSIKYLNKASFTPISQYPDGVGYLEKEIGAFLDYSYMVPALRVYIK